MNKDDIKKLQELQKENAERYEELETTFWQDYYETKKMLDYAKKILDKED